MQTYVLKAKEFVATIRSYRTTQLGQMLLEGRRLRRIGILFRRYSANRRTRGRLTVLSVGDQYDIAIKAIDVQCYS